MKSQIQDMDPNFKKEILKKGTLLMSTPGNWDYYLYNGNTYSISKNNECHSCWFGEGIKHFKKIYNKEMYYNGHIDGILTKTAKQLLEIK